MYGFRSLSRSFVEAAALGLLATAVLYVPPVQIAVRLDGWLFDIWSQLHPPPPPDDVLLVDLATATPLSELTAVAEREAAQLVISTSPRPPIVRADMAIGPTEVPTVGARSQPTTWPRGGHLWFEAERDGVIRQDHVLPSDGRPLPSLPLYAAQLLAAGEHPAPQPASLAKWLRFHAASSFPVATAEQVLAQPAILARKIIIAGNLRPQHTTPIGVLGTPELVAHVLSNYRFDQWLRSMPRGDVAGWIAALLVLLALNAARTRALRFAAVAIGVVGFVALSALAFDSWAYWLPVTGPAAWLLLSGCLLALRPAPPSDATGGAAVKPSMLFAARRAAAEGRLSDAWSLYKQTSPDPDELPELYELGCALEDNGAEREAADVYQRIVQVDGQFRDVAERLLRTTRGAPADDAPSMPSKLGRYELLQPIGRGAMGYVYLGRDPIINRVVALKAIDLTLDYDGAELESVSESFLREATIAGSLSHPNIVTIFDVGETDGLAYIAMEYLKGRHLCEYAAPERLLPVTTVLDLLSRTADALDYAHAQNVVHRDIKPANIMYDSASDSLKITDFGIAKLIDANRTRTGIVLGTPAFMSPEQLEGRNVNGHTDLFALGVSLYQLLTGYLPFRGASMTKLMFVIANEPHESVTAVRGDLPAWLDEVVDKALAKDPAERFQSGAEMAAALRFGLAA